MNKPISKLLEYTLSIFDTALYRIFLSHTTQFGIYTYNIFLIYYLHFHPSANF